MRIGLFPGQGLPAKVVIAALRSDDRTVSAASGFLGFDLVDRVDAFVRRERSVMPTALAQPAIFTASVASWISTHDEHRCDALLGHSLGEYAALVAAGAISFEDGLALVKRRGELMDALSSRRTGGMVAVLDLAIEGCESVAADSGASIANDNAPGQVVMAGDQETLVAVAEAATSMGGRAVRLEVTGSFHTSAMAEAGPSLGDALTSTAVGTPEIPVISNVSAEPYRAPGEIRRLLVEQLTKPVRFRDALGRLWDRGFTEWHDFGPGRVVGGLAARNFDSLRVDVMAG